MRAAKILMTVFAISWATAAAWAHAFLDHADPPVGRTVATSPAAVHLWFTEPLEAGRSYVRVFDAQKRRVDRDDSKVDPADRKELEVSLPPLPPGRYTVEWRAVTADTHTTKGHHDFRIAAP